MNNIVNGNTGQVQRHQNIDGGQRTGHAGQVRQSDEARVGRTQQQHAELDINPMGNLVGQTSREDNFSHAYLNDIKSKDDHFMRDAFAYVLDREGTEGLDIATATSDPDIKYIMHQDSFYKDETSSRIEYIKEKFPEVREEFSRMDQEISQMREEMQENENLNDEQKGALKDEIEILERNRKSVVDSFFEINNLPQVSDLVLEMRDRIKSENFFSKRGDANIAIPRGRMNVSQLEDGLREIISTQKRGGIGFNEDHNGYEEKANYPRGKNVNIFDPQLVTKDIFNELGIPYVGGASGSTADFVGILADQLLKSGGATIDNGQLVIDTPELQKDMEKKVFTYMMGMVECGHHSMVEMVYAAKQWGLFQDLPDPVSAFMTIQSQAFDAYDAIKKGEGSRDTLNAILEQPIPTHEAFMKSLENYGKALFGSDVDVKAPVQRDSTAHRTGVEV
ncbi:hypothetical protein TDB9533_00671 [Thalassocella blandensis]|nr:hypothetical protein TDB9533_00671 [Thalassocella blandensis]